MTKHEEDIVAWANEQAALLRAGNLKAIDAAHIADELESLIKREYGELANLLAALLANLLVWQIKPDVSIKAAIRALRKEIKFNLKETPSLKDKLTDQEWLDVIWTKAVAQVVTETGLNGFPEACPWSMSR